MDNLIKITFNPKDNSFNIRIPRGKQYTIMTVSGPDGFHQVSLRPADFLELITLLKTWEGAAQDQVNQGGQHVRSSL